MQGPLVQKIIENFKTATAGHSERDPPECGGPECRHRCHTHPGSRPGPFQRGWLRAIPRGIQCQITPHPTPLPQFSNPNSPRSVFLFCLFVFFLLIAPLHLSKSSRDCRPELWAHLTDGSLRSWKCQGPGQEWQSWETNPGKVSGSYWWR